MTIYRTFIAFLVVAVLVAAAPTVARSAQPGQLTLDFTTSGLRLAWQGSSADSTWARLRFAGRELPARLIAVSLPTGTTAQPLLERLVSASWSGQLRRAAAQLQADSEGNPIAPLHDEPGPPLPTSPLTLLREGHMAGTRVAVFAFSPLFLHDGALHNATDFSAFLPGAQPFAGDARNLAPLASAVTNAAMSPALPQAGWRISIKQAGIQELTRAQLAALGLDLASVDPARLRLRRGGLAWALEERRDAAGSLAALRFYAPPPGDRWNSADSYWLDLAGGGNRIGARTVGAPAPEASPSARSRGTWRANKIYVSPLPGSDGDSWYAAELCVLASGPCAPDQSAAIDMVLNPPLPLLAGSVTLTITGGSLLNKAHRLRLTSAAVVLERAWQGRGSWSQTFSLPAVANSVRVELLPTAEIDRVYAEGLDWEAEVDLDFAGRGADFWGKPGMWSYAARRLPAEAFFYDISDPAQPVRLDGAFAGFADQPGSAPRHYLVADATTLVAPVVSAYTPLDLATPLDADALYIGPAIFAAAAEPLLAQRRSQGYVARYIDIQAIYDGWSYGQVAPEAIRNFLRYAATSWARKPVAVTLVGDGTSDPHNYLGRNNINHVPPFLARVDPWLGEVPCENCYVQLDGDNPLSEALPDLMLGRLPVKSAAELSALVAKLIDYEQQATLADWRGRIGFIADNADYAGDFAAQSERIAALAPAAVETTRVYYDPNAPAGDPWRERDPWRARERTIAALERGAAVVVYNGHGLQYQWGVTGPPLQPGQPDDRQHMLGLYDSDGLHNTPRLPIVLSMTCLTSAFQQPAYAGTTLDERLLLNPNGGAAAVWGSAGYGISEQQGELQYGFFSALWATKGQPTAIGSLLRAGYMRTFTNATTGYEVLQTFLLLGDPLARSAARIESPSVYLPLVR